MSKNKFNPSRRDFLKIGGQSVASGALLRAAAALGIVSQASGCGSSSNAQEPAQPPPPSSTRPPSPRPIDWPIGAGSGKKVVILGAGIAGMCAAFEMNKLGYEVVILEAQERVGGRCQTIRSGDIVNEIDSQQICEFDSDSDLYFNPGPARIPHHHDLILGYCREFGVALEPFINQNYAAYFHSTSAFNGQPQIARSIIADIRGYIADLLTDCAQQGQLSISLSANEQANLESLLQQFGALNTNGDYVGTSRAGFIGQEVGDTREREQLAATHNLVELLNSNYWQYQLDFFEGLDQQATMLQPVGGMDRIASAFEQQVGHLVVYQAQVNEIRKTSNGIIISFTDEFGDPQSESGDYCICTIPATVLRDISNDFSSQHASAINNFTYTQSGKLAFQSPRFWEQQQMIYGGISWTDQDITQIWYPSHNPGQQQGIIVGAYTFGQAQGSRFSALSPAQRISSVTNQASNLHSQFASQTSRGISVSWPKMPFQLGAWGVSDAGVLTSADDNIYFAGEHLSILQGWQEGAILSSYHAIDQIVSRDTSR